MNNSTPTAATGQTNIYDEEPPDSETYVADCYFCGRTYDAGLTHPGKLAWCGTCDKFEEPPTAATCKTSTAAPPLPKMPPIGAGSKPASVTHQGDRPTTNGGGTFMWCKDRHSF